jgi:glycine/D-amino acid oxidase-like deaminating enzyme
MDLTSPHAFWLIRNGLGDVPEPMSRDEECDVLVIGAGVTGAMIADALARRGLSVIVIDRRHPAHGSTSSSTALLQYELDAHLVDLVDRLGRARAIDAYRACLDGVRAIGRLAAGLDGDIGFNRRPSLYFASRAADEKALRAEGAARRRAGLPSETLDRGELRRIVDFSPPIALWSPVNAEVDPWRLTHALLSRCRTRDARVYGRTDARSIEGRKTHLLVQTDRGRVRAGKIIVAAGYESDKFLPRQVAKLHSTYAMVTEPVTTFRGWGKRCLIWESSRPYLYARTTPDGRIMAGGEDVPFRNPRLRDAKVGSKARKLLGKMRLLFPRIEMEIAYGWAGTFAETEDTLPYLGSHPGGDARVFFALGYGANGMPFSGIAAEILSAAVMGESHRYLRTFAFDR